MRLETKTSRFLDPSDKVKFYDFLEKNHLRIGEVADKLNISYVYLTVVLNGKRAFTSKLQKNLEELGFKLWVNHEEVANAYVVLVGKTVLIVQEITV